MSRRPHFRRASGFTLIETMIVLAVVAIVLMLAAPSMRNMIDLQRLRGTSSQVTTDLQFTRTEAVSRQEYTGISFGSNSAMTCYIVHTCGTIAASDCSCDCTANAGARCAAPRREVRTVQFLRGGNISVAPVAVGAAANVASRFAIDPSNGAIASYAAVLLSPGAPAPVTEFWLETSSLSNSSAPVLRTMISPLGRPTECVRNGNVSGIAPC